MSAALGCCRTAWRKPTSAVRFRSSYAVNDSAASCNELDSPHRPPEHTHDLSPRRDSSPDFEKAGRAFNESAKLALAGASVDPALEDRVNREPMQVERNWCNPDGIPGRPWFKHSLYAARYTYAHLELPGVTEAAEAKDWNRAEAQKTILIAELKKNTALLQQATSELESGETPLSRPK